MDELEGRLCYNIQQIMLANNANIDLQQFYFRVLISANNRVMVVVGSILPNDEINLVGLYPQLVAAINHLVRLNMLYVEGNSLTVQCAASDEIVMGDPVVGIFRRHVRYLTAIDFAIDNFAAIAAAPNDLLQIFDDFRNGAIVGSGDMAIDDMVDLFPFLIFTNIDLMPDAEIMLVHYQPAIPFLDSSDDEDEEDGSDSEISVDSSLVSE